jgi:conjugal transfer pilus assembly protein TraE
MRTSVYLQKAGNLFLENRLLKFVVVILAVAAVFNSLLVLRAVKYQRVILIPPQMTGTIEFTQGKPTDTYIRDLARRIINLSATYSPATARGQFDELLALYAPESFPKASATWYALAGRIEEARVSTAFYLDHLKITKDEKIELSGMSHQFSSDMLIEKKQETFIITYRIQDGRFYIVSLSKKEAKWQEKGEKHDE